MYIYTSIMQPDLSIEYWEQTLFFTKDCNLCNFCKEEPETIEHLLWGCHKVSDLWHELKPAKFCVFCMLCTMKVNIFPLNIIFV
jgi:hypothetical protein